MTQREAVVAAAVSQIGCDAKDAYYQSALGPGRKPWPHHWSGCFCLWALHEAGLLLDIEWSIGFTDITQHLKVTRYPDPGDWAHFTAFQHDAIVEEVGAGFLSTIDGNSTGGKVQRIRRARNYTGVTYYSIARFIHA